MSKPVLKIAVVSDVVCPWCYIGKRRLEKAMESVASEFEFDVAYYPFELNPSIAASGVDQKKYLSQKFGGESEYQRLTGNVTRVAKEEGLDFRYDLQNISPNTRNAHRLILFAKDSGKDLELVEALFRAYFTNGVDLSKNENLASIAGSVGLNEVDAKIFLDGSAGAAEVVMAETELQRMGISGVPFYIINDKYGISGAQPSTAFVEAFRNVTRAQQREGEICDVDSKNC
jgi:predicted DsbA family dithiol-disulfide isomerase